MRRILMLLALCGLPVETVSAANWCSVAHDGATNCSFGSVDLCRANVAGVGGFCIPEAPIGHRQPRAADLPAAPGINTPDRPSERQRRLDRSLQLCRGC